jgi:hypothetical protein
MMKGILKRTSKTGNVEIVQLEKEFYNEYEFAAYLIIYLLEFIKKDDIVTFEIQKDYDSNN